jgi:hypothetical protein
VRAFAVVALPVGAGIRFLSGIIGVGGGIFLSPLIILMKWADAKRTAAASAAFIWINSLAGLTASCCASRLTGRRSSAGRGGVCGRAGGFVRGRLAAGCVWLRRILGVVCCWRRQAAAPAF